MAKKITGGCNCGAIKFTASDNRTLWYCHCEECRKATGNFMAATQVDLDKLQVEGTPKWYYVTEKSRYGFCENCGSQLFWRNDNNPYLSVTGGVIDDTSEIVVGGHIYTSEKADYVCIPDHEVKFITYWDKPPV